MDYENCPQINFCLYQLLREPQFNSIKQKCFYYLVANTVRPHLLPVALNIESIRLQEALDLLKFDSRDQVLEQLLEIE
jgi:hypothetical protein